MCPCWLRTVWIINRCVMAIRLKGELAKYGIKFSDALLGDAHCSTAISLCSRQLSALRAKNIREGIRSDRSFNLQFFQGGRRCFCCFLSDMTWHRSLLQLIRVQITSELVKLYQNYWTVSRLHAKTIILWTCPQTKIEASISNVNCTSKKCTVWFRRTRPYVAVASEGCRSEGKLW